LDEEGLGGTLEMTSPLDLVVAAGVTTSRKVARAASGAVASPPGEEHVSKKTATVKRKRNVMLKVILKTAWGTRDFADRSQETLNYHILNSHFPISDYICK
jgi:hypothetical protein